MKYCKCGKKNDFTAKFCSNCGHPFVSLADIDISKPESKAQPVHRPVPSPPTPPKKTNQFRTPSFLNKAGSSDEDDEDEEDTELNMNLINSLSGLEVDITPSKPQTSTIGGLMETGSEKSAQKLGKGSKSSPKVNKKKILDEIKKEGSSIRNG